MKQPWGVIALTSALVVLLLAVGLAFAIRDAAVAVGCLGVLALALGLALLGSWRAALHPTTERPEVRIARRRADGARRTVLYDGDYGLYQLWYFHLRLREEAERCSRYGLSMAVLVVQLDPSVKDQKERPWQVHIAQAAHVVAGSVRAVDITAVVERRTFAICLVHCDRAGAETAEVRILEALKLFKPTVGSVIFPEEAVESSQLVAVAQMRCASPVAA